MSCANQDQAMKNNCPGLKFFMSKHLIVKILVVLILVQS